MDPAEKISEIILTRDNDNFSANLFKFFDGFANNLNVDTFLEKVEPKYIDLNFLKVIKIWKNLTLLKQYHLNLTLFIDNLSTPGIFYLIKGDSDLSQKFSKVWTRKSLNHIFKELLLLWSLKSNKNNSEKY